MKSSKSITSPDDISARIVALESEIECLQNVEVSGVIDAGRQADIDANKREIAKLRKVATKDSNRKKAILVRASLGIGRTVYACFPNGQDWPISNVKQRDARMLGLYDRDWIDITACDLYSTNRQGMDKVMLSPESTLVEPS